MDRLLVTFEGIDRVRKTNMNILLGNYEMFKMKFDETFSQMFMKFIKIVNGVANQGKTFTVVEKINKLLRALPKEWSHVKTSIHETMRILLGKPSNKF